ncbi:hypothetical protein EDC96DRAFT_531467 [Choanephora cucurbitarum]|nr:hypothetical protein EDC96DRAFT_531467 [Choanephora cucurbitarum]
MLIKQSSLKQTLVFIILTTTIVFIWLQIDSIKRLSDQHKPIVIPYETDPVSWPIQRKENEPILRQASLFPEAAFSEGNSQSLPSVTAVINRVDRSRQGVIETINHLSKYPFIKEITIYNQLIERPLSLENLSFSKPVHLIETPLTNAGKFSVCANATYDNCYFQDDLWLNTYLDSLYTHSMRYPEHFVVHIRPSNYIDYMTWRFKNQANLLHTGYADLRYGAFVSRQKVKRFLNQVKVYGLDTNQLRFADVYFSIWLNQYPYMITNALLSSGRDSFKQVDTVNNRKQVQHHIYQALTLLEAGLMPNISRKAFDTTSLMPIVKERDVRSSCFNDRCLFITNMSSMPDIESDQHFEFNSSLIANISLYEQAVQNHMLPSKTSFIHHYEGKAVDLDSGTCWRTPSSK